MAITIRMTVSRDLERWVRNVTEASNASSARCSRLRFEISRAVVEDNEGKIYGPGGVYAGVDRFGRPLAPPAPSTLKGWARKGLVRQVLAPHGLSSRTIRNFRVRWIYGSVRWSLVAGWEGMDWLRYHLQGAPRGSKGGQPRWSLPRRDIGGITPAGWTAIRAILYKFNDDLFRRAN
jgi:hypothetical protein